eukprot:gene10186-25119_t
MFGTLVPVVAGAGAASAGGSGAPPLVGAEWRVELSPGVLWLRRDGAALRSICCFAMTGRQLDVVASRTPPPHVAVGGGGASATAMPRRGTASLRDAMLAQKFDFVLVRYPAFAAWMARQEREKPRHPKVRQPAEQRRSIAGRASPARGRVARDGACRARHEGTTRAARAADGDARPWPACRRAPWRCRRGRAFSGSLETREEFRREWGVAASPAVSSMLCTRIEAGDFNFVIASWAPGGGSSEPAVIASDGAKGVADTVAGARPDEITVQHVKHSGYD